MSGRSTYSNKVRVARGVTYAVPAELEADFYHKGSQLFHLKRLFGQPLFRAEAKQP
ncbi:hypothetical protein ACIQZG_04795 [Lysinibacillus sp. NPDC096418]|uniref:hypothetical protein n=1 Tax=Lysinibacillus sp. NPDC096418 TaxID=3364138 RepID=UPI003806921F